MKKSIIVILLISSLFVSCEKFAEVPPPPNRIVSSQVFTTDAKAEAAINGIYSYMMSGSASFSSWYTTVYAGASADELMRFNPGSSDEEFIRNELSSINGTVGRVWSTAYNVIYQANSGLEGLSASTGVSDAMKSRLLGEYYFLRAFSFWYLLHFFGDVPIIQSTNWEKNSSVGRNSIEQVYTVIENDLLQAQELLPVTYPTVGKARVNKWAATAMLARFYLYRGQWQKAVEASSRVLNSGEYKLETTLRNVFLATNNEAIWQLVPRSTSGYIPELVDAYYTSSRPVFYMNTSLVAAFDANDQRRKAWVDSITYMGNRYYWPGKYKDISATNKEYYVVLRAAELFLIRAEAQCMLQQFGESVKDLNVIRKRAGLADYTGQLNQEALLQAIAQERRFELFAEWGNRWFDLKRTNKADEILGPKKGITWQSTDQLWPIPQIELDNNVNLHQNPGY